MYHTVCHLILRVRTIWENQILIIIMDPREFSDISQRNFENSGPQEGQNI